MCVPVGECHDRYNFAHGAAMFAHSTLNNAGVNSQGSCRVECSLCVSLMWWLRDLHDKLCVASSHLVTR